MIEKDKILEIADFEPFFMYLFGIRLTGNLKPQIEKPPSFKSNDKVPIDQLNSIEEIESYFKEKEKRRKIGDRWMRKNGLQTLPQSLNDNINYLKVSPKFESFKKMTKQQIIASKSELRKLAKVSWLSNDFYQIGIKTTSTKEYFNYISTTEKRDVSIRFKIWFQYERNGDKKLEKIALFFQEFQKFEEQIKDYVDSMIFQFDELGTKKMTLKLINGSVLERTQSKQHPSTSFDFNELYNDVVQ